MRKWILCILVILCLTVGVCAAETVMLEEVGVTLTIPDGYTVFYIGMPEDAPQLAEWGYTHEEMMENLRADNSALIAVDEEGLLQYALDTVDSDVVDFCYQSDFFLKCNLIDWSEGAVDLNGDPVEGILYPHEKTVFYAISGAAMESEGTVTYLDLYQTVHGGKDICLYSYERDETAVQQKREEAAAIIDGMELWAEPKRPQPLQPSDPQEYVHEESGAKLVLPADWVVSQDTSEEGLTILKLNTTDGSGVMMEYRLVDYSSGTVGDDMAAELWSARIVEALEEDWGEILSTEQVTYGAHEFTCLKLLFEESYEDRGLLVPTTVCIMVKNGYGHVAAFYDRDTSIHFETYEAMLNSLTIPEPVEAPAAAPTEEVPAEPEPVEQEKETSAPALPRSLARRLGKWIGAAIVAAGSWISLKFKKKLGKDTKSPAPEKVRLGYVCPGCGKEIQSSSLFCSNCGRELKRPVEDPPKQDSFIYACPKCGHQTTPGRPYCSNCGSLLNWDANETESRFEASDKASQ